MKTYVPDARFAEILTRAANDRALYPDRSRHGEVDFETGQAKNLQAIKSLIALSYPDVRKLRRIRIEYEADRTPKPEKRVTHAWLVSEEADELVFIDSHFGTRRFSTAPKGQPGYAGYIKHETVDFLAEIRELVKHEDFDHWIRHLWYGSRITAGTVWAYCYNLAVFAYQLRHEDEADALIRFGMRKEGTFLWLVATDYAFEDFLNATETLYKSGHEKAIPHLEHLVKYFAFTKYGEQAQELLDGCRRVVKSKAGWSREDPSKLDPTARARYWAERLPDVAGMQSFSPGSPQLFGSREDLKLATDELVAIGRPAIPELIECLTDDRPTRSIYFHRSFDPHRLVVRVGGAAVACINRITNIPFYVPESTSSWFCRRSLKEREAFQQELHAWWEKHKDASQAEWIRSRIGTGRIYEREEMLVRLIRLDGYEKVKPILKQWLASEDPDVRITAAAEMADNGDLSAMPQLRSEVLEDRCYGRMLYPGGAHPMVWIVRCDKANGVETLKQYILRYPSHPSEVRMAFSALEEAEPQAALRACVELLDARDALAGEGAPAARPLRVADLAAESIQKISKVDFGFALTSTPEKRDQTILAIRKWWEEKGKSARPPAKQGG